MLHSLITLNNTVPISLHGIKQIRQYSSVMQDDITEHTVDATTCKYYAGDFYGLLNSLNVPVSLHGATASLNEILSPDMYDGTFNKVKLFNLDNLTNILNL